MMKGRLAPDRSLTPTLSQRARERTCCADFVVSQIADDETSQSLAGLVVDVQHACPSPQGPSRVDLTRWVAAALNGRTGPAEVTIRLVDAIEATALNERYRGQARPTNVLSFPFEPPPGLGEACYLLGDLVICAPLVADEAAAQRKALDAHWAHLVIHGVLHLLGHDHQEEVEAETMRDLETVILRRLGFDNPYEEPRSRDDERPI